MSIILAGSYAATLMVDPFIDDRVSANFVVYVDHSPLEQSEQIYASMTPGIQTPELVISAPSTLPVYPSLEEQQILHRALLESGKTKNNGFLLRGDNPAF